MTSTYLRETLPKTILDYYTYTWCIISSYHIIFTNIYHVYSDTSIYKYNPRKWHLDSK